MITIRQAQEEDMAALCSLFEKPADYFARCLAEQNEGKRQIFIAAADGLDSSFGVLNWAPRYALYKRLGIPEIQDLNTISAARGQGLASALIAHCEDLARKKSCDTIGISVGLHSRFGAAQRLYVKLGYVPDGFGVTYDRQPVTAGEFRPVDDDLCLMMVKALQ